MFVGLQFAGRVVMDNRLVNAIDCQDAVSTQAIIQEVMLGPEA